MGDDSSPSLTLSGGPTERLKRLHTEEEGAEEELLPPAHPSLSSSPGGAPAVCSSHLLSRRQTHTHSSLCLIPTKDESLDVASAAPVAIDGCDICNWTANLKAAQKDGAV